MAIGCVVGSLALVASAAHGVQSVGRLLQPVRVEERPLSPYIVRAWTADDGLPVNSVTAIEQTADGYLWLGTFGGLVRFDGVAFRTFTAADVPGLGDDRILALREDRSGTLWIGTRHNGVFRLRDGVFSAPAWSGALPSPQVRAIHEGRDGALWIHTVGGVARVVDGERATVLRPHGDRGDRPDAAELVVVDSVDGIASLGVHAGGLAGLVGADVRSIPLGAWQDTAVPALAADTAGTVWVSARPRQGLLRLVGDRLEPVPLVGMPQQSSVSALLPGPDADLWVGTDGGGLFRLDGTQLRPVGEPAGLSSLNVRVLYRDREENLWVGTDTDGLYRLTRRSVVVHQPASGPGLGVVPIVGDGAGGVWAGAACGGLLRIRDGFFERYGEAEGLPADCIWALHRDADDTLWIGKVRGGLLRLREGQVTRFTDADGLQGDEIRAILRDEAGTLWVGTESAVNRLGAGERFTAHRLPVQPAFVTSLIERRAGGLWVGTGAGLFRLVAGAFTHWGPEDGLSHGLVRALLEDTDGTLWIGTYGGGLNRLRDGRITRYSTATGLYDMFISHILDDGRGRLWMSSNHGVFHVARAELEAVADERADSLTSIWFDRSDGMPSNEANGGGQPAGWRAADGRLWFPTVDGLVELDPAAPRNPQPPPVAISRVVIDRRSVEPSERIELPAGTRSLEIHYAGLSYRAPEKVGFRYRLAGYDDEWVDAGARRAAYYTGLRPGRYRFQVRARNEDGIWSDTDAVLRIRQVPYFYQTPWSLALGAGLVLALAAAGYRLRLRALVRRTETLEAAVVARTEEVVEQSNRLAEKHRKVQKAHGDLLAILDQTGVGVCLVDNAGEVEFLNVTAENVLGCATAEATGRSWQELLSLSADDRRRAEALLAQPASQRRRVPLRLDRADHHRYWIELDIRDDPRDAARHIFYLHDVTELFDLQGLVSGAAQFQGMIGETAVMRMVYRQIRDVAMVDSMVILEGETGTGKELAARAIHDLSSRKGRPYVAVNCAGLTESLLASQLFGHRRGAFTGAVADQTGLFEAAAGGTLLLDEVGDIPPSVQASLLRVLEEGEITRVGDSRPRKIDVRVVAATHRDLDTEVEAGRFRQDLYYRLRVARIRLPPLRERRDDIPLLVAWFLARSRKTSRAQVYEVSREAMRLLVTHPWPGNVRELRGVIESAVLGTPGPMIEVMDLPEEFLTGAADLPATRAPAADPLDSRERRHLQLALERTHGNRAAAARLLGISRTTLYR
ncbi:MAG: sigma 54-interacting transcriptional regulator, partial [Thermoanaerobaculia bacterium]